MAEKLANKQTGQIHFASCLPINHVEDAAVLAGGIQVGKTTVVHRNEDEKDVVLVRTDKEGVFACMYLWGGLCRGKFPCRPMPQGITVVELKSGKSGV